MSRNTDALNLTLRCYIAFWLVNVSGVHCHGLGAIHYWTKVFHMFYTLLYSL